MSEISGDAIGNLKSAEARFDRGPAGAASVHKVVESIHVRAAREN